MQEELNNLNPSANFESEEDLLNLVNNYMKEIETPNYDEDLTKLISNELTSPGEKEEPKPQTGRKYAGIFNSIEDLEKSYKELQSEYTRVNQKYKKFEKYESLIDLIEKDPRIRDKIVEIIYSTYYNPTKGTNLEEENLDLFEETTTSNSSKLDYGNIQRMVENVINEKLKEFFGVVNAIQEFATKHNLDRDTLKEIIEISKREGITLDEALSKYNEKISKIKEKLLKEIGAVPQKASSIGANTTSPQFTSTNLTGATRGQSQELDFSQGWSKLPREKQLELLMKYSPFI